MDVTDTRARTVFAEELTRAGEAGIAARVLDGTDNSNAGTAALAAMRTLMREPHPVRRALAYEAIDSERTYQEKWAEHLSSGRAPTADFPGGWRSVDEFAGYIYGYAHDALMLSAKTSDPAAKLTAIRKVAALCVACMETHGAPRREGL